MAGRSKGPRTVVLPSAAEAAALVSKLRGEVDSDFMETVEVEVDSLQLQALEH